MFPEFRIRLPLFSFHLFVYFFYSVTDSLGEKGGAAAVLRAGTGAPAITSFDSDTQLYYSEYEQEFKVTGVVHAPVGRHPVTFRRAIMDGDGR